MSVWYWERGCGLSHINNKYLSLLIVRHYRHTSFYCTSLYRASQVLCFLQVKDLWQPCVKEVYKLHFSNSICSLCVLCHILVILTPFQTFSLLLYLLWRSMISDLFFFFLAALGLCCCTWAFSRCGERGLLFIVVHGLLIAVASLLAEHGL